jgi:molybdate transport system substrate-binding protein
MQHEIRANDRFGSKLKCSGRAYAVRFAHDSDRKADAAGSPPHARSRNRSRGLKILRCYDFKHLEQFHCSLLEGAMRVAILFEVIILSVLSIAANAAEIRVIASPGLTAAFKVLAPQYEHASGNTLAFQYGLGTAQKQRIVAGDFDLAIVPVFALDSAIKDGKIVVDTRTVVARVDLGVGVRVGGVKPDVASVDAFKRAMLAAKSVTYVVDEPAGRQITKDFETLGIADVMKAKVKPQDKVAQVWQAVASGEAELGFGFTSNLLSVPGVQFAGSFPTELQYSVAMVAGIGRAAHETDAAKAFIKFLLAPETVAVLKAKGLEPPAQ